MTKKKAAGKSPAANVRHVILSEAKDLKLRHCEERSDVAICPEVVTLQRLRQIPALTSVRSE